MVRVCLVETHQFAALEGLGFRRMVYGDGRLWFHAWGEDEDELAALFAGLRDIGCAFSRVHETSQLFDRLREAGKIDGTYTEIDWLEPGKWVTSER